MQYEKTPLPLRKAISFCHAVRDEDCFTIFWELANSSPEPVPFENICRTFGADPRYLWEILGRLLYLGIATRAGHQWTVCDWAKTTLDQLEETMKDFQIEIAQPESIEVGTYANNALQVATLNGFWIASASQVTAQDRSAAKSSAANASDTTMLNSPELIDKPENEARSHDYK
jgi:hypothetical protein